MVLQTKLMRIGKSPEWYVSKKTGEKFATCRAAFQSGSEVIDGVTVPKTTWADVIAFGENAEALADCILGKQYPIEGEWSTEEYQGNKKLKVVVSTIFPVVENARRPAAAPVDELPMAFRS
jgi:single-stranded DNA-binding protein